VNVVGKLLYVNPYNVEKYYGLRIQHNNKTYDIDMDTCRLYNLEVYNLPEDKTIVLKDNDGKLCSDEEIKGDLVVEDISSNVELLDNFFYEKADRTKLDVIVHTAPVYVDGLAVELIGINDLAGEFSQFHLDYAVTLWVKNEETLKKVCDAIGSWKLRFESAVNSLRFGTHNFDIVFTDKELKAFSRVFNFKLHIPSTGVSYTYKNMYSKQSYCVKFGYPYFDLPFNMEFDYWTGSIAEGRSLYDFVDEIKNSLTRGTAVCFEATL
jgi:hypothetical protein